MNLSDSDIDALLVQALVEACERFAALPPEQQRIEMDKQRESYARSITEWPKASYRWVDGVKVYASYEDYCND